MAKHWTKRILIHAKSAKTVYEYNKLLRKKAKRIVKKYVKKHMTKKQKEKAIAKGIANTLSYKKYSNENYRKTC